MFLNPDLISFVKILVKEDQSLTSGTIVAGDLCEINSLISLIIKMVEKDRSPWNNKQVAKDRCQKLQNCVKYFTVICLFS